LKLAFGGGEVEGLRRLAGGGCLKFLGYIVDLDSGEICDSLSETGDVSKAEFELLQVLLEHYAKSEPTEERGKLVKFANLPGGHAYEKAFLERAVRPIAATFGDRPEKIVACAWRLGGQELTFGDCSVEIPALPHLPLTFIAWRRGDFPAEANILFDETASKYLPTEDLAVLGELATARLLRASEH